MKRSSVLLVSLNARYIHKAPAVWMLRQSCAIQGIAVDVMEADIARPHDTLLRDILRYGARYIGFSCSIWNITRVERLTAALRTALPDVFLFWGGPEVSFDAEERMADPTPGRPDAILCGEGEEILPAMLKRLLLGKAPDGTGVVTAQSNGGIAPPVALENWVHLYPPGAVAEPYRLHYVETARGCPFACSYCLSSVTEGIRALSADAALERILSVVRAGADVVKVLDRTFNFDAERGRRIWEGLIRYGGDATYHFEIAAHLLEERDIDLLLHAPAGLFQMEIGVQTTNESTLERIGRRQPWERLSYAVRALSLNTHLHLDLIAGLPGDTYADIAESIDKALSLKPDALQLGFLKLLPGSPLRAEFDARGWPYDPSPPYEIISNENISQQELSLLHDIEEVISLFYNSKRMPQTAGRYLCSFTQLESVATALRREGFFNRPHSPAAQFDALWRALPSEREAVELLKKDWLSIGKQLPRPWML